MINGCYCKTLATTYRHCCNGRFMDKTRSRFSNSSPMGNGEKSDQHHKHHTLAQVARRARGTTRRRCTYQFNRMTFMHQ